MGRTLIFRKDGSTSGELELNPAVFGARVNKRLLDLVMKAYAGNQRRGTHDTKERAEVRGGGKKPWRQKGTGRARQGSRRAPQWRGGGTVFGPHPRDYDTALSDTMKQQALISALSLKNQGGHIKLVDDAKLGAPKTKELIELIKTLGLYDTRTLLIVGSADENLKRASSNLKELCAIRLARDVNAYHIQRRQKLLIEKEAVSILEKRALGQSLEMRQEVPV